MIKDQEFLLNGSIGRLQVRLFQGNDVSKPAALILHPNPLLGGTMNNVIVYDIYKTLANLDISVLRLNFRSIDKSQGFFDNGKGEIIDSAKALDFLIDKQNSATCMIIIGYGFGAHIALQLAMRRPEIGIFIFIAGAIRSFDYNFLTLCPSPGLLIQGSNDNISDPRLARELYYKLKQKNQKVVYQEIEGATHSFANYRKHLKQIINTYIQKCSFKKKSTMKKTRKQRKKLF